MTDGSQISAGNLRDILAEAGIDIRQPVWPYPGYVRAAGHTVVPSPLHGVLIVDMKPCYSAAWL